ncbi:hypothetical protein N867_11740, partial [Actinotalea fermentans ATCC 43279 = JCM 9966 = DSM 3133]
DALVDVVTRWLDAGTCPDGTPLPRRQRRRPHLQVTVAASTLAGDDDAPADLAGYGPISADMAREIARDATCTVVGIDPRTGEARTREGRDHGLGRTTRGSAPPGNRPADSRPADSRPADSRPADSRPADSRPAGYRPPAALADDVLARDRTCTFPGCRVQAMRCDLDHIEPFDPALPADDQTVGENLHALCRHHHNLKTHGGWQVRRDDATGRTVWTAPTGHEYAREPVEAPGADTSLGGATLTGESTAVGAAAEHATTGDGGAEEPPPF